MSHGATATRPPAVREHAAVTVLRITLEAQQADPAPAALQSGDEIRERGHEPGVGLEVEVVAPQQLSG
jgi:hypothetical protein